MMYGIYSKIHEIDEIFAAAVENHIVLPKESIDTTWEIDLSGVRLVISPSFSCGLSSMNFSLNVVLRPYLSIIVFLQLERHVDSS